MQRSCHVFRVHDGEMRIHLVAELRITTTNFDLFSQIRKRKLSLASQGFCNNSFYKLDLVWYWEMMDELEMMFSGYIMDVLSLYWDSALCICVEGPDIKFKGVLHPLIISPTRVVELFDVTHTAQGL